jgi:hypothetical protein
MTLLFATGCVVGASLMFVLMLVLERREDPKTGELEIPARRVNR